jgi:hypothetical protein
LRGGAGKKKEKKKKGNPDKMDNSMVDFTEEAEGWRRTLPAVSLTFGIAASIIFAVRAYASRLFSCKLQLEDILMGVAVTLMWGTIAAALTSQ